MKAVLQRGTNPASPKRGENGLVMKKVIKRGNLRILSPSSGEKFDLMMGDVHQFLSPQFIGSSSGYLMDSKSLQSAVILVVLPVRLFFQTVWVCLEKIHSVHHWEIFEYSSDSSSILRCLFGKQNLNVTTTIWTVQSVGLGTDGVPDASSERSRRKRRPEEVHAESTCSVYRLRTLAYIVYLHIFKQASTCVEPTWCISRHDA